MTSFMPSTCNDTTKVFESNKGRENCENASLVILTVVSLHVLGMKLFMFGAQIQAWFLDVGGPAASAVNSTEMHRARQYLMCSPGWFGRFRHDSGSPAAVDHMLSTGSFPNKQFEYPY